MVKHSVEKGRKAWRRGFRTEIFAVWYLRFKGYRILAGRYKTPMGEIDIVAQHKHVLVFVEVKARRSLMEAAGSLGKRQQKRVENAAQAFRQSRPDLASLDIRFDVLLKGNGLFFRHVRDAWRPGDI